MEVNAKEIKNLRTGRGWTQQHLADVCAISLRTVQRVERYGNASQETLASLASVFEVAQSTLIVEVSEVEIINSETETTKGLQLQPIIIAGFFGAILGASMVLLLVK